MPDLSGHRRELYALIAAVILIWGTAYLFITLAIRDLPSIWMVSGRTILGALGLYVYMRWRGRRLPGITHPAWRWYGLLGLTAVTIPFFLLGVGQQEVESGLAAIIVATMPLFTIVMAHFFIKGERLSVRKIIGFLLGFSGVVILFLPEDAAMALAGDWLFKLCIMGAAFGYAISTIIAKRAPDVPASVSATMIVTSAAIASTIAAFITGVPDTMPGLTSSLAVLALAIGSTGMGNICYMRLIQLSGPTEIAKINYAVPFASVAAGWLFLGEPFEPRALFALGVIIVGLVIARSGKTKL